MELAPDVLPPEPILPDELLIIRNPVSANSHRAQRQIADLQERFPFSVVDVFPTLYEADLSHEENRQANQQRVLDLLQERTDPNQPYSRQLWLVIATGDGTIRDIGEALLGADEAIRNVPILPLAGGNGNDNSTMAHRFLGKHWPAQRLRRAHIEPVQPLECTIRHHDGSMQKRYALGYLSVGELVAKAAKDIDQDRGRNRLAQLINEKILAGRSLANASLTEIAERESKRQTGELIFSNGNRMAKYFHWDQSLTDPQFTRTEITKNSLLHIAKSGIKLMLAKHPSIVVPDGNLVEFQNATGTWIQFDGEAFLLPARSTITVRRAGRSLNIVHLK
ncbi:MAG TPA: hypothetical protein VJ843_01620 [Candidatus Saccharimonadales bacterium]|nr:hypothetical protein [Candidatus Saccharimonadales bacterium]